MSETEQDRLSRRTIVGGMTTGLIGAVAGSALGQQGRPEYLAPETNPESIKRNPISEYVHPPFPAQHQPPPGLVIHMTPRPDHGEESYRGSGRLRGRRTYRSWHGVRKAVRRHEPSVDYGMRADSEPGRRAVVAGWFVPAYPVTAAAAFAVMGSTRGRPYDGTNHPSTTECGAEAGPGRRPVVAGWFLPAYPVTAAATYRIGPPADSSRE